MKNAKILIISFMILSLISVFSGLAQLSVPQVKLGSDLDDRNTTVSVVVTVTNIGPSTVQNLAVTFPGASSKYGLRGSLSATSLAPNASAELTVSGFIPPDLDAVDSNGNKISVNIGSVQVAGLQDGNVLMEAQNELEFSSGSEIKINSDVKALRNDRDYKEIRRNDNIELTVEIENRFSDSGDCQEEGTNCDIDDIDARIRSSNSALDVDESLSFSSLSARDTDSDKITFDIPDDIDDRSYDVNMGNQDNASS